MRLRLSVPHLADVADVKRILCRTVDSFYRSHPHFTPDADIGAPALAPEHLTVAELSSPLANGFFELQKFLEDRWVGRFAPVMDVHTRTQFDFLISPTFLMTLFQILSRSFNA